MKKFRQRWGITSNFQIAVILLVFALTGSTSAYLSKPILEWMALHQDKISGWIYYPLYIILIFPVYKVLLIVYGTLFGQFTFFYAFLKKMLRGMGLGFILGR